MQVLLERIITPSETILSRAGKECRDPSAQKARLRMTIRNVVHYLRPNRRMREVKARPWQALKVGAG